MSCWCSNSSCCTGTEDTSLGNHPPSLIGLSATDTYLQPDSKGVDSGELSRDSEESADSKQSKTSVKSFISSNEPISNDEPAIGTPIIVHSFGYGESPGSRDQKTFQQLLSVSNIERKQSDLTQPVSDIEIINEPLSLMKKTLSTESFLVKAKPSLPPASLTPSQTISTYNDPSIVTSPEDQTLNVVKAQRLPILPSSSVIIPNIPLPSTYNKVPSNYKDSIKDALIQLLREFTHLVAKPQDDDTSGLPLFIITSESNKISVNFHMDSELKVCFFSPSELAGNGNVPQLPITSCPVSSITLLKTGSTVETLFAESLNNFPKEMLSDIVVFQITGETEKNIFLTFESRYVQELFVSAISILRWSNLASSSDISESHSVTSQTQKFNIRTESRVPPIATPKAKSKNVLSKRIQTKSSTPIGQFSPDSQSKTTNSPTLSNHSLESSTQEEKEREEKEKKRKADYKAQVYKKTPLSELFNKTPSRNINY